MPAYKSWKRAAGAQIAAPGRPDGNRLIDGDGAIEWVARSLREVDSPNFTLLNRPSSANAYLAYQVRDGGDAVFAFIAMPTDKKNVAVLACTDDADLYRCWVGRALWASGLYPEGQSVLFFDLEPGETISYEAWNGAVTLSLAVTGRLNLTDTRTPPPDMAYGDLADLIAAESFAPLNDDNTDPDFRADAGVEARTRGDILTGNARKINTGGGDYQESRVTVKGASGDVDAEAIAIKGNVGPGAAIGRGASVHARTISGGDVITDDR